MPTSANLECLTNSELHQKTVDLAHREQQTTLELMHHLHEVERRKLFAERGYGSLWEYVQKALGYSESQAYERISAMRLMVRAPRVQVALESGKLTVTQAAMTERHVRAQERALELPVPAKAVEALIGRMEGLSKRETEKLLLEEPPEPLRTTETLRSLTAEMSELRFPITEETRQAMERFWNLKGRCSVSELFSICLKFYLNQKDPREKDPKKTPALPVRLGKSAARAAVRDIEDPGPPRPSIPGSLLPEEVEPPKRYIPAEVKQATRQRSRGRCEYVDSETGRRCESRYLLQFDHIDPYCSGGASDEDNIRHLCRVHNQYLAIKMFQSEAELLSSGP